MLVYFNAVNFVDNDIFFFLYYLFNGDLQSDGGRLSLKFDSLLAFDSKDDNLLKPNTRRNVAFCITY